LTARRKDRSRDGVSYPTLTNVLFVSNSAGGDGGATVNNGRYGDSSPTLVNVVFHDNTADWGGALVCDGFGGVSSPALANVTFAGNAAAGWAAPSTPMAATVERRVQR
jgi:hypothetical protein